MFVLLADTLAEDFDLSDVLDQLAHACVDLLGATAAGILLVNSAEGLQVVASSSENSHLLDVFQLQAQSDHASMPTRPAPPSPSLISTTPRTAGRSSRTALVLWGSARSTPFR
jgi:GAF domain-containing protein